MKTINQILKNSSIEKVGGYPDDVPGHYHIKHPKIVQYRFMIVASDGLGWEHVSISIFAIEEKEKFSVHRCPTWEEMCFIKDCFWNETETVVQYHPAKSEHVSVHPYCLHLWRPLEESLPLPNKKMVG